MRALLAATFVTSINDKKELLGSKTAFFKPKKPISFHKCTKDKREFYGAPQRPLEISFLNGPKISIKGFSRLSMLETVLFPEVTKFM